MKLNTAWLLIIFLLLYALAFARTHVRNQATIVGYEIGRLKRTEQTLLEQRSHMQMELARLTSKEVLQKLAAN